MLMAVGNCPALNLVGSGNAGFGFIAFMVKAACGASFRKFAIGLGIGVLHN